MDLKIIDNYRKNEIKCWKTFFALTALAYIRPESQKELGYPLLCNYKGRSGVYRKNLSKAYDQLLDIAHRLLKLGKDLKKESIPENIFIVLCTMIDTAEGLEFFSNDQDGWRFYKTTLNEAVQEMISEWRERYYNALMEPVIGAQKETEALNKKITEINDRITVLEKELGTTIDDKKRKTEIAEKRKRELQDFISSNQENNRKLDTVIAGAQNRISELNKLIVELEGRIIEKERKHEDLVKRKIELQKKLAEARDSHEDAIAKADNVECELQQQIDGAMERLNKALFLKRSKQAQLDQLRFSLQQHLDERAREEEKYNSTYTELSTKLGECEKEDAELVTSIADLRNRSEELGGIKKTNESEIEEHKKQIQNLKSEQTKKEAESRSIDRSIQSDDMHIAELNREIAECRKQMSSLQESVHKVCGTPIQLLDSSPTSILKTQRVQLKRRKKTSPLQTTVEELFDKYYYLRSQLMEMNRKKLFYSARKHVYDELSSSGFAVSCPEKVTANLSLAEHEIARIQAELREIVPYVGFDYSQEKADGKTKAFLKKADRSFELFWKKLTDGSIMPVDIMPFATIGHCLQTKESCYLWFNPFYVLSIKIDKKDFVNVCVYKYSDISFNMCDTNVTLGYGKECPAGATIVSERWQYENANGSKSLRYKNNQKYYIVSIRTISITLPDDIVNLYYFSSEDATSVISAYQAHTEFLSMECSRVIEGITTSTEIPDVVSIYGKAIEEEEAETRAQKEQEKKMLVQQKEALKRREQEKKQEEKRRSTLEKWAKQNQEQKIADEALMQERMNTLTQIDKEFLSEWQDTQNAPIVITNSRRTITNGICKLNFLQEKDDAATKYIVFFVNKEGEKCSDVRVLSKSTIGTGSTIPFEINTKNLNGSKGAYLLIIDFDTGVVIDRIEFKVNITFMNDFDL